MLDWKVTQYYGHTNMVCIVDENERKITEGFHKSCEPELNKICGAYNALRTAKLDTTTTADLFANKDPYLQTK